MAVPLSVERLYLHSPAKHGWKLACVCVSRSWNWRRYQLFVCFMHCAHLCVIIWRDMDFSLFLLSPLLVPLYLL